MSFSHKIRVGVLRGGPSPEYEVSLKTGAAILSNMPEGYEALDIFISKDGAWHMFGFEKDPYQILKTIDVAVNAMHGSYGEDGTVQKIFEHFNIPHTGSGSFSSALAMNKVLSKNIYKINELKTPHSLVVYFDNLSKGAIKEIYQSMLPPFVVKPSSAGSSVGVYIVNSLPELEEAVIAAAQYSPAVLIEEFIKGKEATCGVIDGFRGQEHYALLPIEIRHNSEFFDYKSKYTNGGAEEICPGDFSKEESKELERMAVEAHKHLGLRHYSRSDFIVHPKRGIFILETNSLPGLTEQSLIPKALNAVGSNLKEFISHLLSKTLAGKN